jgi:predicted DNA-binding mobile mystery protein A
MSVTSRGAIRSIESWLRPWRQVPKTPPKWGGVRSIREALGMSLSQMGRRLKVTAQAARDLERREVLGTISLETLRRAADALDCDLVYALVPRRPLLESIRSQARRKAEAEIGRVAHSMKLEGQGVAQVETDALIEDRVEELVTRMPRNLWDSEDEQRWT